MHTDKEASQQDQILPPCRWLQCGEAKITDLCAGTWEHEKDPGYTNRRSNCHTAIGVALMDGSVAERAMPVGFACMTPYSCVWSLDWGR
uniref:Uncharacterized protein n=1 Tax=Arundo donax TaxID=35708 RepID=A0A0A9ENX7_ARUDO